MSSSLQLQSPNAAASPERTLRRLFLTLFLRGRSSRGLHKDSAPKSLTSKLALTLVMYAAVGLVAMAFMRQPVFALSLYLHGMTLVFLGMFIAASSGEVLFNKEEADILLHRPVTPRALLWAKIGVLVEVSLWLAGAFNLAGLLIGVWAKDGGWLFPVVHIISTALEALFCTACVVLVYQLCLRWFGRERLDGLMTTAQVLVTVAAVVGGQVAPQLITHFGGEITFGVNSWWIGLLPPAWFAGIDDALAGRGASGSWALAALGVMTTAAVLWLAFGKLARDYEAGLQTLNETTSKPRSQRAQRRWLDRLANVPPLRWCLRDSITRAAFLLTAAYLMRDRDVKLRIYPGLAPMLAMPIILLVQNHGADGFSGFGIAFAGAYLGLIPLLGLNLIQYSQQWQASDLFRAAPLAGPGALCSGAQWAVLFLLTLPVLAVFAAIAWIAQSNHSNLALLLPGVIALPVYSMLPSIGGKAVPLSLPTEEAKSAGRGLKMIGVMFVSMALSGAALTAWAFGYFNWFLVVEAIIIVPLYFKMRSVVSNSRWQSME